MIKKIIQYLIFVSAILAIVFGIYRSAVLSQMPDVKKVIPVKLNKEEIPVLKRPGTQSIRIVGPPLKLLKFQIDFNFNPQPLDWKFLERIDKRADIMIEGSVNVNGKFAITRFRDRGHPEAGQYIKNVVESWTFMPYKKGLIKYYFNVPTRMENMKIQIDVRKLVKNFDFIGPNDYLKNGLLCYVEGIEGNNIMIIQ